jgi:hypothetical protein
VATTIEGHPFAKTIPWHAIEEGQSVALCRAGELYFSGVVDARTEEGDVIWLVSRSSERRLFFRAEELVPYLHEPIS